MSDQGTIGLLLCYVKLYDEVCPPELRQSVEAFAAAIAEEYRRRGVTVKISAVCRTADEFQEAVTGFEHDRVDAIVSLHLAYSPSLASIDAVAASSLPLIVLDTTPSSRFGFDQTAEQIMFNHGIHGVQDFCNLLRRRGKSFQIAAGHWQQSDVIDRTVAMLQGCRAAAAIRTARVGILGQPFAGMGDFALPFEDFRREIGFEVISATSEVLAAKMPSPDDPACERETASDRKQFRDGGFTASALAQTEAAGLAVRRWMTDQQLSALTINFQNITGAPGLPVVPFLEASKTMARGLGYAGEGDVLTAALCRGLLTVNPATSFTEMFCPDWEDNRIFLSHMGEIHLGLTAATPLLEQRSYPFSAAGEPVIASGCFRAGRVCLLNLAPGPDHTFLLTAIHGDMEVPADGQTAIDRGIRGWFRPDRPLPELLAEYSRLGGTHHLLASYDLKPMVAAALAAVMNWNYRLL